MKKIVILAALLAGCGSQSSNPPEVSRAVLAAQDEGYTNVTEGDPVIFGCSKEDSAITSRYLEATNVNGKRVKLLACCGLFLKGCTIRHD